MADNPYAKYVDQTPDNPYAKYAASPAGDTMPEPATPFNSRTPMQKVAQGAGMAARDVVQSAMGFPALAATVPAGLYNLGANVIQGYHKPGEPNGPFRFGNQLASPSIAADRLGLAQEVNPADRLIGDAGSGMIGAGTGIGLAKLAQKAASPVTQAVGRVLAANPGKQIIGGATGGLAAGGAREAGLPVPVQMAAGLVGGAAPFAPGAAMSLAKAGSLTPAESRVMGAGYTLPPATMESPSTISKFLGGWSGKIKSQQGASVKNQVLTNQIAASELGLPRDAELTPDVFKTVRQNAATAYGDVSRAAPVTHIDEPYIDALLKIESRNSQVADYFPELSDNTEVTKMVNSLSKHTEVPTPVLMQTIRGLREDATKNLQAIGDVEKANLGFGQRSAANALEDLIDRNLTASGNTEAISKFRAARQLIAKSHDIESATNPSTGEVGAARFGALMKRGRPLSGGLATIADAANAAPKATQMPSKFGGLEPLSVLDILGSAGSVAAGHPELGLTLLGRPLARTLTLSPAYQRAMLNRAPMGAINMALPQAAIQSNIYGNNQ